MAKRNYPVGSANTLINYLEGRDHEKAPAAAAAHDLLGYGMQTKKGTNMSVTAGIPRKSEDVVKELKAVNSRCAKNPEVPPVLPDWYNAFMVDFLKGQLTT